MITKNHIISDPSEGRQAWGHIKTHPQSEAYDKGYDNIKWSSDKERDWEEDSTQENGNYWNLCMECNKDFIGNKHRITCKKCTTAEGK